MVFHRWNSCKQNKQAANTRAATDNQMVTPEGEKLHSDSGISVDTQSLQDQQLQQAQADVQAPPTQPRAQEQIGQCTRLLPGNSPNERTQTLAVSSVGCPERHHSLQPSLLSWQGAP